MSNNVFPIFVVKVFLYASMVLSSLRTTWALLHYPGIICHQPISTSSSSTCVANTSVHKLRASSSSWDWVTGTTDASTAELPQLFDVLPDETQQHSSKESRRDAFKASGDDLPYQAGYVASKRTQERIQRVARDYETTKKINTLCGSSAVLKALLNTKPHLVNEVNVMCALVLSVKLMPQYNGEVTALEAKEYKESLGQVLPILWHMVEDRQLSARQLANAAWALGKVTQMCSVDVENLLETICYQILEKIEESSISSGGANDLALSPAEVSMTLGALAWMKPRNRPAGWKTTSQNQVIPQRSVITASRPNGASVDHSGRLDIIFRNIGTRREEEEHGGNSDEEKDIECVFDLLFDSIAKALVFSDSTLLKAYNWETLSNVAWAYAHRGLLTPATEKLAISIARHATARMTKAREFDDNKGIEKNCSHPLPRDISLIAWSLGAIQVDCFRLGEDFEVFVDSAFEFVHWMDESNGIGIFRTWKSTDLVQLSVSLAHARIDNVDLLEEIFDEANRKIHNDEFKTWEVAVMMWVVGKLHLTSETFEQFSHSVTSFLLERIRSDNSEVVGIGAQEQANLAWSFTVLEHYSEESIELLQHIFQVASSSKVMQTEHAHQLWQALFVLNHECPEAVSGVSPTFKKWLKEKWREEKARMKTSSARHRALSETLNFMGIPHFNEHDEDIDVAIILGGRRKSVLLNGKKRSKIALEFDGPSHFVREGRRPLGDTLLKYRLLKHQGWDVVRVPYYEFDKIPFWASMERQRYLQRVLKTKRIRFSEIDVSEYREMPNNRKTRFD